MEILVRAATRLVTAGGPCVLLAACAVPLGRSGGGGQASVAPDVKKPGDESHRSPLTKLYDLDQREEELKFKPHDVTYFGGSWTTDINEASNPDPVEELEDVELEFQISLKTRIPLPWMDRGGWVPDFWFGYTQQSQWQVGQPSGPFRESNYEPEGFLLWPLGDPTQRGGARLRFAGIGYNHQSNGRGGPESRSWNRIIGQLGIEFGESTSLLVRPWWRIPESARNDDNPDIDDYLGDGDLQLAQQFELFGSDLTAAALVRNNLDSSENRGGYELSLSGPFFHKSLAWYALAFHGYGKTLIDYDHRQTVLTFGLALRGWDSD